MLLGNMSSATIVLVVLETMQCMHDEPDLVKYRDEFVSSFLLHSKLLSAWWTPDRRTADSHLEAVNLFHKLLSLQAQPKYSFDMPEFIVLLNMYLEFIQDPSISLSGKGMHITHACLLFFTVSRPRACLLGLFGACSTALSHQDLFCCGCVDANLFSDAVR
jgi:hypothetical protein